MKLLFVVPLLSGMGGIQASLVNLVRALPRDKYSVSICVFGNRVATSTALPSDVAIIPGPKVLEYCLTGFRATWRDYAPWHLPSLLLVKLAQRLLGYRRMLDFALARFSVPGSYDVAIAYANDIYASGFFIGGANDIVLRSVSATRRLAWIHNDPIRHGLDRPTCLRTYTGFDGVINVSSTIKAIFDDLVPEYRDKSHVVYNLIDSKRLKSMAAEPNPYPPQAPFTLVTVARLHNEQKRIDRAIEACVLLKERGLTDFSWHIVGDGPDEKSLRAMAHAAHVEDVLIFEGRQANPFPFVKHADALVLPSDYEAYPMVLLEARALGVPIVATRYAAAAEIVTHGHNGYLADLSSAALADTLELLMRDGTLLRDLRSEIAAHPTNGSQALRQFDEVALGPIARSG